jgi:hypothetical protein
MLATQSCFRLFSSFIRREGWRIPIHTFQSTASTGAVYLFVKDHAGIPKHTAVLTTCSFLLYPDSLHPLLQPSHLALLWQCAAPVALCETKCYLNILASSARAVGGAHRVLCVAISVINHGNENVERERRLGLMQVIKRDFKHDVVAS